MINSPHAIRSFLPGVLLLLVSGCNSNDSVDTTPIVEAPTVSSTLIINGAVKSADAGNATVSITVGAKTYTSAIPTDASGAFQFEIDNAADDDLVRLESFNPVTDVRLVSIAGNYKQFAEKALNGQVSDTKISALSTAFFTLAQSQSSEDGITDAEQYLALMSQVKTRDIIKVASALKIVTDSINDMTLPFGYTDTVELAIDIMHPNSKFIENVELQFPGTYATAVSLLLANSDSAGKFSRNEQAGVFTSDDNDSLYALYQNGSGIASFSDQPSAKNLSNWSVTTQGQLVVDYAAGEKRQDRLSLLLDSISTKHTLLEQISLPNNAGYVSPAKFDFYKFGDSYVSEAVPGAYILPENGSSEIVLNADGTATRLDDEGDFQSAFTWSVDAKGRVIMAFDSGEKTIMTNLKDGRISKATLMTSIKQDGSVKTAKVVTFERK